MPLFEHCCAAESCDLYCIPIEHFFHDRNADNPQCEECGGKTERLVSRFNAPWTGDLGRFNNPEAGQHNTTPYGHIAYKTRSTHMIDGSPEPVHIDSIQKQREYCKQEGLTNPSDVNPNLGSSADGKISASRPKGSWV